MNDHKRRQRIRALQAKADSTTFPGERDALLAKISELRGKTPVADTDGALMDAIRQSLRTYRPDLRTKGPTYTGVKEVDDFIRRHETGYQPPTNVSTGADAINNTIRIKMNFNVTGPDGKKQKVTDVNGRTYWVNVE